MKKIDLGQAITILANIGVIAGILFLAVEVRQNQESLDEANRINRVGTLTEAVENFNAWRTMLLQDAELNRIWNAGLSSAELDSGDRGRFDLVCQSILWAHVLFWERSDAPGQSSRSHAAVAAWRRALEAPGLRRWWDNVGRDQVLQWDYGLFVFEVEETDAQL